MAELKFTKGTDSEHKVKVDSTLVYAAWKSGGAVCGEKATFEVGTAFVGNGAPIKITGKSEGGKKIGKIKDVITYNRYLGSFDIPEDFEVGDEVYFEVELSKQSLNGESDRILVIPPIRITNLKWSAKEARRGDELTLTADIDGLRDGAEVTVTIYEYDADSAHDRIVELPATVKDKKVELCWEYEYHEDTDGIATADDLRPYKGEYNPPEYFFTVKAGETEVGTEQESGLLEFKDYVDVELLSDTGQPLANAKFKLVLADGSEMDGTADGDGKARVEDVPPGGFMIVLTEEP